MSDEPPSRAGSARERLLALLQEGFASVPELAHRMRLSERQVVDQLGHLERSLAHRDIELEREAPTCVKCGFRFDEGARLSEPSRCPQCRSDRITPVRFRVV